MITNYGWTGFIKGMANAQPLQQTPFLSLDKSSHNENTAEVISILDYTTGEIYLRRNSNGEPIKALPLNSSNKQIPIEGETVVLAKIDPHSSFTTSTFYHPSINIWSNPSLNSTVKTSQISKNDDESYFSPTKVQHISNLISLPGDTIYEGRFGQSIRFGNTNSNYSNNWSSMGETGDPITIINNGQPTENRSNIENIKYDLSSIYLTSYQSIANFSLANENFTSFRTKPSTPSEYVNPQIILDSNRISLNAKTDEVLISGEKSVGLSSNDSINIEAGNETIISGRVFLGDKSAKESALLGDTTLELLTQLITEVKNISLALQTIPSAVGPVATLATPVFEKVLKDLSKITSNTVKLK